MDREQLRRLIDGHERFPDALRALLRLEDRELLRSREAEGRWSPLEILAHLADEEVEDFRARAEAAVGGRAEVAPIDPQGWVLGRRYNDRDPAEVMARLEAERAVSCAWLRSLAPEDLDRTLDRPGGGSMRAADFVAAWRMHDLLHLRQLGTALARLEARRLAGHRLEYAGELPPAAQG
jgi:hypothetical protein